MGQVVSYALGTIIASTIVGCLILVFYITSDTYAAQAIKKKPVGELIEIVSRLKSPGSPRGEEQNRVIGAVLQLGEGEDELEQRINSLAIAGNRSDSEFETAAQIAIKKLGPVTHKPLMAMLDSGDQATIGKAVILIRLLGEDAAEFVPKLIEMVESGDPVVTRFGVFGLQDMGKSAIPAVDALNDVILSLDFNAQIMVCKAVVGMGRDAAPMADNLAKIFEEGIVSPRSWAGIALGAIGPIANFDTAKMLGSRVNVFGHVEKIRALEALAIMGDEAESQADVIKAVMLDPKGRVRPQASYAYYCVTGETEDAIATMSQMLTKINYKSDTLIYLRKMGPDAKGAIPQIRKLLTDESVAIREQAVLAIGNMGSVAINEIHSIGRLASDPDPLLRQAVEESVAAIRKDYEEKRASENQ